MFHVCSMPPGKLKIELQALETVRTFAPDLALLDIGLPVMDGYELAQRLKGVPTLASIHLVAVSGYGQDLDRRRSNAAGFDEHLLAGSALLPR